MKKSFFLALLLFACYLSHATIKTVIANAGTGWQNANNFSPTGVPQNGDIVIIPVGATITIKGNIYGNPSPSLTVNIFGTLDFDPSGKLALGGQSLIQIFALGKITTNGTSSELISIDGVTKYNGKNDGTLYGPLYASAGPQQSSTLTMGSGFSLGVLDVQLVSFTGNLQEKELRLNWEITNSPEVSEFIVQRKTTDGWQDLASVLPSEQSNATNSYSYTVRLSAETNNLYRLKIISKSSAIQFSSILSFNSAKLNALVINPNPVSSVATIKWSRALVNGKVSITNSAGVLVNQFAVDNFKTSITVNLAHLNRGLYHVLVSEGGKAIEKGTIVRQ